MSSSIFVFFCQRVLLLRRGITKPVLFTVSYPNKAQQWAGLCSTYRASWPNVYSCSEQFNNRLTADLLHRPSWQLIHTPRRAGRPESMCTVHNHFIPLTITSLFDDKSEPAALALRHRLTKTYNRLNNDYKIRFVACWRQWVIDTKISSFLPVCLYFYDKLFNFHQCRKKIETKIAAWKTCGLSENWYISVTNGLTSKCFGQQNQLSERS